MPSVRHFQVKSLSIKNLITGSLFASLILTITTLLTLPLAAQNLPGQLPGGNHNPGRAQPNKAPRTQGPGKKVDIPIPNQTQLLTKDKFNLAVTYYPPPTNEEEPDAGKSVVPFIVVHNWKESREQTNQFAKFLQLQGNAVIIPDLRGHGVSTTIEGRDKPVTYDKLSRDQRAMVIDDLETCKKFLVKRNNDGEVNIDLLNVVAVGDMAPVATQWVLNDWTLFPPKNTSGIKQAQDVKGLVLIAPKKKFGAYSLSKILKHPLFTSGTGNEMPIMLVWGEDDKVAGRDAKSIYTALEKGRPELPEFNSSEERLAAKTLFEAKIEKSEANASQLIGRENVKGLWKYIANTMTAKAKLKIDERPWINRASDK
ncbi:MAG: hypothetical protein AAFN77_23945 [Planctomycetota bacterium]